MMNHLRQGEPEVKARALEGLQDFESNTSVNTAHHVVAPLSLFTIECNSLAYITRTPSVLQPVLVQCRDEFLNDLSGMDEFGEPVSTIELVSRFLAFIANQLRQNSNTLDLDFQALLFMLQCFESDLLNNNEIHAVIPRLVNKTRHSIVIRSYYAALERTEQTRSSPKPRSALLRAAATKDAVVFAVFGGQGNTETYLDGLKDMYTTYPTLVLPFLKMVVNHIQDLVHASGFRQDFAYGLDVLQWLDYPTTQPDTDYLLSTAVSVPLIGSVQLVNFLVTCKILDQSPGSFVNYLSGISGHSQGIVIAAAVAACTDWDSFEIRAKQALTTLFWIGVRSQEAYPRPSLPFELAAECESHGDGVPSLALSIRGLSHEKVRKYIETTNNHLPQHQHVTISLINSPRNLVVTGPPMSLCGLNRLLRGAKGPATTDETRAPYSQRKSHFVTQFLPISAPFHSKYLEQAIKKLENDLKAIEIPATELRIPVYSTSTGQDIREDPKAANNIVQSLARMICIDPVLWEPAVTMPGASHILEFGPGGETGVGALISRMKEGTGARVILATIPRSVAEIHDSMGYKDELFSSDSGDLVYASNWSKQYSAKLFRTGDGRVIVDTKLSRHTGLPPLMVAGMTPTTAAWDFVAATMTAGYEIELATGSHYDADGLSEAIDKLQKNTPSGRGIILNLIYANPQSMAWQIPLIRDLCAQGVSIKGVTFGAGVPSLEVANEYVRSLGVQQIGFKPGSEHAVRQVVAIAKANPDFPVIMQWTGGRGGGHHSWEDFHEPILSWYGMVRTCPNIILIVGSGFGTAEDAYPYLNGTWTAKYNRQAAMPFDGVLFGSRCMVAKEAHTSRDVKKAIVQTQGLEDSEWENTRMAPVGAGGILTVQSEMGEPIHKIATRGVILWAELDKTFFKLPKDKRLAQLENKIFRERLIQRLNEDFQKPWFGRTMAGEVVELDEMTYADVICQLVNLLYIKDQQRWIHLSYSKLTEDFIKRIEQQFGPRIRSRVISTFQTHEIVRNPVPVVDMLLTKYPQAKMQYINDRDLHFFLKLCNRGGQKPVPFIPCLDEKFEVWFKKDSLWQSEDLDAVVDRDVGRVCILQGPVATKSVTVADEPIGDILGNIHQDLTDLLIQNVYHSVTENIPVVQWSTVASKAQSQLEFVTGPVKSATVVKNDQLTSYCITEDSTQTLPTCDEWIRLLVKRHNTWLYDFLTTKMFLRAQRHELNPMTRLLNPRYGMVVEVFDSDTPDKTTVVVKEAVGSEHLTSLEIGLISGNVILLKLVEHRTVSGTPAFLELMFTYHPECRDAPIQEVEVTRNARIRQFYRELWIGKEVYLPQDNLKTSIIRFDGGINVVDGTALRDFLKAIGNTSESYISRSGQESLVPMDFAIVAGWKALVQPLLHVIDGDLLRLVHLSNRFSLAPSAQLFKLGQTLRSASEISAIIIQDSGKMIEVSGTIASESGAPLMYITSQFLYRGDYTDFENAFQNKTQKPYSLHLKTSIDVEILKSKKWLQLDNDDITLLGCKLVFHLRTRTKYLNKSIFSSVETDGTIEIEHGTQKAFRIGSVKYVSSSPSRGNPVIEFLRRHGCELNPRIPLAKPAVVAEVFSTDSLTITAPLSNVEYGSASGDFNPIHVSRMFAEYANLPGTVCHGMYISAKTRDIVERHLCKGNPSRMRDFHVSFVSFVLPGDVLKVRIQHVAMESGYKVIQIEVVKTDGTDEKVLTGEAIIEQPTSAYVFTGQGSQEKGMGMDLYANSDAARRVWDRAEKHFLDSFGLSILDIVKNNPREITVHFGGSRGRAIRENYMAMAYQENDPDSDGTPRQGKIFKDISPHTTSYTFRYPKGLLFATQFTQPALTLMQLAAFHDLRSRSIVHNNSIFAGHSLGEYSALACFAGFMPVETLVTIVFYRGLCMQSAVRRDEAGRTNYAMCAVNPSRFRSHSVSEGDLEYIVQKIDETTGCFIQIVNFNIRNMQYVCTGELQALDVLKGVLNRVASQESHGENSPQPIGRELLETMVEMVASHTKAKPKPKELSRGFAFIPLNGIDVPFHSTYLSPGVDFFRSILLERITASSIDPYTLIDKYIPNVVARPFELTKEFCECVYKATGSVRIENVLKNWNLYESIDMKV